MRASKRKMPKNPYDYATLSGRDGTILTGDAPAIAFYLQAINQIVVIYFSKESVALFFVDGSEEADYSIRPLTIEHLKMFYNNGIIELGDIH